MWRTWNKLTRTSNHRNFPPSNFSCSSFKDVQNLCSEDSIHQTQSQLETPKTQTVVHRVRPATSLVRSWSSSSLAELDPEPEPAPPEQVRQPELVIDEEEPEESTTQPPPAPEPKISIPGAESQIVVYLTSLRVVRSTFEDCRAVQSILRGFRVSIDERDLSMDVGFMEELKAILGEEKLKLPRVFIGGRYIGGAEEVRQLHEVGELKKFVEGLPAAEPGVCDVCGGHRFILCDECNGSHKCYSEKSGFRSCTFCNVNGLIRCPSCSSAPIF